MRVLVTGSRGFIGKNLVVRLEQNPTIQILRFDRGDSDEKLVTSVEEADAIVHLAGENRPKDTQAFARVNFELTEVMCDAIRKTSRKIPFIFASSSQAELDNPYGISKRSAELAVEELATETGNPSQIYRLPGVFGKWCKPNYNSVVATFCYNIANDLPIQVRDRDTELRLVYVDDVVRDFIRQLDKMRSGLEWKDVTPEYKIRLGDLASQIQCFEGGRKNLLVERVGSGFTHALYATYVSYLPPTKFAHTLPYNRDERGVFAEVLKTTDCGQFSYLTAEPGVTRGEHYHHSKTEKFLVLKGLARFGFRHILTNETYEIFASGDAPQIVQTAPGWAHNIRNVGEDEMIVMLWANEVFDRSHPDTIPFKV